MKTYIEEKAKKPTRTTRKRTNGRKNAKSKKRYTTHTFKRAKVRGNFLFMLLGIPTTIKVLTPKK